MAKPKRVPRATKMIGWREWVGLSDLGIESIKAKIDTGARTSALHAYQIKPFRKGGKRYVRFFVHPVQRRRTPEIECVAPVIDQRTIKDSGGKTEERYVVRTLLQLGEKSWPIELTLTNRDDMSFRMLIGRAGIRGRYTVNPATSFHMGRPPALPKSNKKNAR